MGVKFNIWMSLVMLKLAVRSVSVMVLVWVACVPVVVVPVVHFILIIIVPLVPFVVPYRMAAKGPHIEERVGALGLKFGFIVGVIMLIIIVVLLVSGVSFNLYEFDSRTRALAWIIVFIAPLYSGSMASLGFMYGVLKNKKLESE